MARIFLAGLALAFASAGRSANADGQAGRRYIGAFWYDSSRPAESLKYQLYDLEKGEYDRAAVDRWLELVRTKHPGHGTYVREVRTEANDGATEAERQARAIVREKRRWADLQRQPSLSIPRLVGPPAAGPRGIGPARNAFDGPSPGSAGVPLYPAGSPFPYPYRAGPR